MIPLLTTHVNVNGKPRGKSLVVNWLQIEFKIFVKSSSDISRKLVSFPFSLQHHHTMKQGGDEKKRKKIYQLGDYYSIQYQILRTNIIRIVLLMRRVDVNRPLFTRSSSSCFPIHLSICSLGADTVSMNVGPVLFFSSFCDIVFSSVVFFCAVDMHVAVANKTNNYIEMTVWNFSYLHKKFCICGMMQYF